MEPQFLAINREVRVIEESSLSRIWSYIEQGKPLGIVSSTVPPAQDESPEEYKGKMQERGRALAEDIEKAGFGRILFSSQYRYDNGEIVKEYSYAVPKISLDQVLELGRKYHQESVIHCGPDGFGVYNCDSGQKAVSFKFKAGRENMAFNQDAVRNAFSSLVRGTGSAKVPFAFVPESFKVYEIVPLGICSAMGGRPTREVRWV